MPIRAIILDVGGVLLHERDHAKRYEWEARLGLARGELTCLVIDSESAKHAASGEVSEREIWQAVAHKIQLTDAQTWELQRDFWSCEQLDIEFVEFLKSLRPQYRMALLSNAWLDARKFHDTKFHFNAWVDVAIYSAEVKKTKPDPRVYQLALSQLSLAAKECVFVDDKLSNVQAAESLGMKGVWFREAVQAMNDIMKCLEQILTEENKMSNSFHPKPEHKFTFGLWTVGNPGGDAFGQPVRRKLSPVEIVRVLAEVGAYGVNLHDNDLVPIDATPVERDRIVAEFKKALQETGIGVPMATTNLFSDPAFKDGAFTANDPKVRAYALQKTMRAFDLGVELGAKVYVFWGGREGIESDATKNPLDAGKRFREALNFLCEYARDNKYDLKFALEAKPNEPRGDIYLPTTGAMLGFIATLAHPEMVGVNPELAHEQMAGLNFMHAVAQAWDAGKLFHIDLNDQNFCRYDQDFRFGSHNWKQSFFLVKFLEDVGYAGSRHFDAHAYRTEDAEGVKDFARGCMRTYLILKDKAARYNADTEIQALLKEINADDSAMIKFSGTYSRDKANALKAHTFDRVALGNRGMQYERLDQLVFDLLMGVR